MYKGLEKLMYGALGIVSSFAVTALDHPALSASKGILDQIYSHVSNEISQGVTCVDIRNNPDAKAIITQGLPQNDVSSMTSHIWCTKTIEARMLIVTITTNPTKTLILVMDYHDLPCNYYVFHTAEKEGNFDDHKIPDRLRPLVRDDEGTTTHPGCFEELTDGGGVYDLDKLMKIHGKFIADLEHVMQ